MAWAEVAGFAKSKNQSNGRNEPHIKFTSSDTPYVVPLLALGQWRIASTLVSGQQRLKSARNVDFQLMVLRERTRTLPSSYKRIQSKGTCLIQGGMQPLRKLGNIYSSSSKCLKTAVAQELNVQTRYRNLKQGSKYIM